MSGSPDHSRRGTTHPLAALVQTQEEIDRRDDYLAHGIIALVTGYLGRPVVRGLDIGCMHGVLTVPIATALGGTWQGIDPGLAECSEGESGVHLAHGYAHQLAFPDGHFDCVVFANVYEHIAPDRRTASLREIHRVLAPGGVLVGQLPNPFFPIESHSRLPFLGCLPRRLQRIYWRLNPTGWDFDEGHFFSVTIRHLRTTAEAAGLRTLVARSFNYPLAAIPSRVRWAAALHARLGMVPWSWQFVFRKPGPRG